MCFDAILAFKSSKMSLVRACIANRRLKTLNNYRSVFPKLCFLSSRRRYSVTLWCGSPIPSSRTCSILSKLTPSTVILPSTALSVAHSLQASCRTIHSDAVADTESTDRRNDSNEQSADDVSLDSDASNLHIPVLAKEVVDLIAPIKGEVCMFLYWL